MAYDHRFTPRTPEQARVSERGRQMLLDGRSFILRAPTGWGKTVVGCSLISAPQRRTLVITTKEDIIKQWVDAAIKVLGLARDDVGLWCGDSVPRDDQPLVVGLVQSIMKGPERYPGVDYASFGLVVCDEVHRMGAEHFSQAMWWFPGRLRLGLSATPYRKDGREQVFLGHIGQVELTATQQTLVPRVVVRSSDWRVPRVVRDGKLIRLPHTAGKLGHVNKLLGRHEPRNRMIARFVFTAYGRGRNTVVFSDSIDHLRRLHAAFRAHGVRDADIGYYVGITQGGVDSVYAGGKKDRVAQREADKLKRVVLATYQMASEATDVPQWDTCVLAVPRSDVVQIVGRIRREHPGKGIPVVLDILDADSPIYERFHRSRVRWYRSIGCDIRFKG